LFLVQPMIGRLVLPLLGGSASVWTTCLVFFQATLLGGYAWAHIQARFPVAVQRWTHVLTLMAGAVSLPLAIASARPPVTGVMPGVWLLGVLAASCAVPCVALASNAPMLQRWYMETTGRSPYRLYAVSNAASLGGLLAYPLLLEPFTTLTAQRWAWSAAYLLEVAIVALCALVPRQHVTRQPDPAAARPLPTLVVQWFLLAAFPASLVAGVTAHLTSDLAPAPLLWVVPLSLYLLTFVISFGGRPVRWASTATRLFALAAFPLLALELSRGAPVWILLVLHLAAFVLIASLCHGRLWALRPDGGRLTEFYLWVALGGVCGGLLNAVIAPLVFSRPLEYPLVLVGAVALLSATEPSASRLDRAASGSAAAAGLAWLVVAPASNPTVGLAVLALFAALGSLENRVIKIAGALLVVSLFVRVGASESRLPVHQARSFYASLRIIDDFRPGVRALVNGATLHGLQSRDPDRARIPLSYYTDAGPIGQLLQALGPALDGARVGVIGLGVGELSAHARAGQQWTFFEIDPLVVQIATDPKWFSYLSSSAVRPAIVVGDGRQSIAVGNQRFQLLVVDAFSSDVVPVHLLTREALELYVRRLEPRGVLAFHVSNRFADFEPVLGAVARDAGLAARARDDAALVNGRPAIDRMPSRWVIAARPGVLPASLDDRAGWHAPATTGTARVWTDERSDVLRTLRPWG
jgi:hypothetical protein